MGFNFVYQEPEIVSYFNVLENIQNEPLWGFVDIGFSERRHNLSKRFIRLLGSNYSYYKKGTLVTTEEG